MHGNSNNQTLNSKHHQEPQTVKLKLDTNSNTDDFSHSKLNQNKFACVQADILVNENEPKLSLSSAYKVGGKVQQYLNC
ncbi:hypothetical protein ABKN59_006057 [Abortiporus biennis]